MKKVMIELLGNAIVHETQVDLVTVSPPVIYLTNPYNVEGLSPSDLDVHWMWSSDWINTKMLRPQVLEQLDPDKWYELQEEGRPFNINLGFADGTKWQAGSYYDQIRPSDTMLRHLLGLNKAAITSCNPIYLLYLQWMLKRGAVTRKELLGVLDKMWSASSSPGHRFAEVWKKGYARNTGKKSPKGQFPRRAALLMITQKGVDYIGKHEKNLSLKALTDTNTSNVLRYLREQLEFDY